MVVNIAVLLLSQYLLQYFFSVATHIALPLFLTTIAYGFAVLFSPYYCSAQ